MTAKELLLNAEVTQRTYLFFSTLHKGLKGFLSAPFPRCSGKKRNPISCIASGVSLKKMFGDQVVKPAPVKSRPDERVSHCEQHLNETTLKVTVWPRHKWQDGAALTSTVTSPGQISQHLKQLLPCGRVHWSPSGQTSLPMRGPIWSLPIGGAEYCSKHHSASTSRDVKLPWTHVHTRVSETCWLSHYLEGWKGEFNTQFISISPLWGW